MVVVLVVVVNSAVAVAKLVAIVVTFADVVMKIICVVLEVIAVE